MGTSSQLSDKSTRAAEQRAFFVLLAAWRFVENALTGDIDRLMSSFTCWTNLPELPNSVLSSSFLLHGDFLSLNALKGDMTTSLVV